MSTVIELIDLTLLGCPMHGIKAKQHLRNIAIGQSVLFEANSGDAVTEIASRLRQQDFDCEIVATRSYTSILYVTKIL